MAKKSKRKYVKAESKPPKPKYYTVGVRFLSANIGKVYTYRIARGAKVHIGQLLVADTPSGAAVVAVVRIDTTLQDTGGFDYKYITQKVVEL